MSHDDLDSRVDTALSALPRPAAPPGLAAAARSRFVAARARAEREARRWRVASLAGLMLFGYALLSFIEWSAVPALLGRAAAVLGVVPTVVQALHQAVPWVVNFWLVAQVVALGVTALVVGRLVRTSESAARP